MDKIKDIKICKTTKIQNSIDNNSMDIYNKVKQ